MPRPLSYLVNVMFFLLFFTRIIVPMVLTVGLIGFVGIVGMNLERRATTWVDLTE